MKRIPLLLAATALLLSLAVALLSCGEEKEQLRVATTTSLYDTGLWDDLEPLFEEQYGVELDVLYAGTGKALEWGRRGDVDVLTVHSKDREEEFVAEGYADERVPFAYNYFLIIGPESDPAGVSGMSPEAALAELMADGQTMQEIKFVSRGDNSGTHGMEKAIWASAGYEYEEVRASGDWYVEAGSGMGPVLTMADEMQAYTLTDLGTYLAFKRELDLVPVVAEGDSLLNVYSVLVCTSTENRNTADNMVEFLTSDVIQTLIGEFGVEEYGRPLFMPAAGKDL